jgi:pantoate--beta-alanine ligase
MIVVSDNSALRDYLDPVRVQSRVAFVPTMGNLHEGHLSLVRQAKEAADIVVVSIFVNPMQFGEKEDLATYPRTIDADVLALKTAGVDVVFTPSIADIYPQGDQAHTAIRVPLLSEPLCGAERPGHFDGVCTVVYKLFRLIEPNVAVFGEKDLQQLLIIQKMVADLSLNIDIRQGITTRASDGLALSSRNQYLSAAERQIAPRLWQTLQDCAQTLRGASTVSAANILAQASDELTAAGFKVDYLELRELQTLHTATDLSHDCALFVAATLGTTRLIDNIQISAAESSMG